MKKVLSFVLFGRKSRYWSPIPLTLLCHHLAFPKFHMRIHVSLGAREHRLFPLLRGLENLNEKLEIKSVKQPYKGTQATLWRMMPLWDKKVKYTFCRDLDAIPGEDEVKAMRTFLRTGYLIHGIRSFEQHTVPLMAGMCGFHCRKLRDKGILPSDFWEYIRLVKHASTRWKWGCDQFSMKYFFYEQHPQKVFLQQNTLDTPLGSARKRLAEYKPILLSREKYNSTDLKYMRNNPVFKIAKKLHSFASSPILHKKSLRYLPLALEHKCELSEQIKKVLKENPDIESYYL